MRLRTTWFSTSTRPMVRTRTTAGHRPGAVLLRALGAALVFLVLTACGESDPARVSSAAVPVPDAGFDPAALIDVMVAPSGPTAAADFLASLPAPSSSESVETFNRHRPGQVDEIRLLAYPGVEVSVYHVSHPPDRLPLAVRVSREDVTYLGLEVGIPLSAARAALAAVGEPAQGAPDTFLVLSDDAAPHTVTLESSGDRLDAFTVTAYLD